MGIATVLPPLDPTLDAGLFSGSPE